MSENCTDWLEELRTPLQIVLEEDLASLSRMNDRRLIQKYNEIKENEEEFQWEFRQECPDTLRDDEPEILRSRFRLARLLIVASFAQDGAEVDHDQIPDGLDDEFAPQAIKAVVDFEQYKQFDNLTEEQINTRIRRMDGEVYELVKNYTNTQLANLDDLLDVPNVQGDVMDQLSNRYDDRLEKIRQGFYTYVEHHGMDHMVSEIEGAIKATAKARSTEAQVQQKLTEQIESLEATVKSGFQQQKRHRHQQLREIETELAASDPDIEELKREIRSVETGPTEAQQDALKELRSTIDETESLKSDLENEIQSLREAKQEATTADTEALSSEVASIVDGQLGTLEEQRSAVTAEIEQLRQERQRLEASSEDLKSRQTELAERVEEIESSVETDTGGLDGESVVTSTIARLLEMDYLGRFEASVHSVPSVRLAEETRSIPDGYWDGRSERRSERPRLQQFLDDDEHAEQYPVNTSARFTIDSSGFMGVGRSPEMIIEAAVCSDLEAHATNGFDASPATLDTLLEYVNRSVYEAEQTDVEVLLGIASPTGWSESVRRQISQNDISRTKYSRRLSIVLIDLQTGELTYDSSDPVASENARLFELPIDQEQQSECEDEILSRFNRTEFGSEGVLLETLVDEAGFTPHIVKRTFNTLANREAYEQKYLDGKLVLFES
ncbi:hypothetical protein PM076_14895 [Halorubrum ezzemoulense]|uniref:hypothetical protein n=1 Tax=Halorubrum ezzemoulense TaxID=337243 RepID=UPI00232F34BF|nr:hypothetical protein [Halorubrum ezzemoulense]MDB2245244.1 hypothetical protein [Halorubrum ezzemoulense]MDB2290100.1 hypothetical protein [Halorubrum ezzemoulense]MDB2297570.1 hypothetical protein [Halorubrum ezzemoulense]MDB2301150.1 hypothetical protein [Halorubrum ezzemoulense]